MEYNPFGVKTHLGQKPTWDFVVEFASLERRFNNIGCRMSFSIAELFLGHVSMIVGKRVVYQGRVQGVGFRYTAQHLAGRYADVAGYVCNLASGDVELVVEGEAAEVDAFLAAVGNLMADGIDRTNVQDETPIGRSGFHIRY